MSGLTGVLDVALTGLDAYRTALNTVSENISNATTPGYARRRTALATSFEGPGQSAGTGVRVQGIQRITSDLAETRLRSANADSGYATTLASALDALQNNFPLHGGVGLALSGFLSDAQNLAARPADSASRQTLVADGRQLAGAFQQASGNIEDSIQGLARSGGDLARQVNQLLQGLATINQKLRGSSSGAVNGLLDNQNQLLHQLSGLLGFNVIRYDNGAVRLAVDGQVLLDSAGASTVTLTMGPGTTPELRVSGGHALRASSVGGELGGAFDAILQSKSQLQNLDWMAALAAGAVNHQQALGLDATGGQGKPLFSMPSPTVVASTANAGTETLQAALKNPAELPSGGGPFTLRYTGTEWQATNQENGKTINVGNGNLLFFDGIQVSVAGGAPQAGDAFTVNPVAGAAEAITFDTTNPNAIAAAAPYVATPGTVTAVGGVVNTNTGNATLGAGTVSGNPGSATLVAGSAFGQPLVVTFTTPTAYTVATPSGTALGSGTYSPSAGGSIAIAYPAGSNAAGSYWVIPISGNPAAGDTFTLEPGGSQSGTNAGAIGALVSSSRLPDGGLTAAWAAVTGSIGYAASSANTMQSNASTNLSNATAAQQAVSGVSLDQQAADMQMYTQAYEASAKAVSTVNQLFQSLIQAV